MDAQDFRSLQEAYLEVYQLDEKEDSPYEKASDAALDSRYGYGRAQGDKRSFGRAANRSSAAAALRAIRRGERSGSGTSREAGSDAVHQGWAKTAKTSTDQTPEKKAKRAQLANTPYSKLPDDEKEKDRVSFDAVRATYNRNKTQKEETDLYDIILSHLLDEGYADTQQAAEAIMVNMSEEWRESIVEDFINERVKYSDNDYRGGGGDEKRRQTGMSSREVAKLGRQNINRAIEKEPLGTQIKQKAFGREVPVPPNAGFKPGGLRMLPATAPGSIFSSPSTWRSKSGNINNGYVPVEDNIIEGPDYNRNTNFSDNDYRGGGGDEKRLRTGMSTREVSQLGRQNINRAIEKEPLGTQIKQKLFGREVPVPPNAGFKPGGLRMLPDKKSSGRPTLKGDPLPGPRAKYHGPAR